MRNLMLAACCAVLLTACGRSTTSTHRSPNPRPPERPAATGKSCVPPPQHRQPDGSAVAADDDATIRDGRLDLAECEARRRLLWDAWPR